MGKLSDFRYYPRFIKKTKTKGLIDYRNGTYAIVHYDKKLNVWMPYGTRITNKKQALRKYRITRSNYKKSQVGY